MTPKRLAEIIEACEMQGMLSSGTCNELFDEIARLQEQVKSAREFIVARCYCGSIADLSIKCVNCQWLESKPEVKS